MNGIITEYKKGESELLAIGGCVLEKMENNELFLPPPPALAELKIILPEFHTALSNARGRDKEMIAIKNNKKVIVQELLQELAEYVTATCKGNKALMLSSGFDVINQRRSNLKVTVEKLEVKLGLPGEATTRARNVTGARAFMHQYTTELPGPQTIWVSEGWGLSYFTYKKLISDKRYWFRVVAIGSGTQRAFSPVVSVVIQ